MKSFRFFLIFVLVAVFFSTSAQSETGKFSPAAKEPGESKILLVDDDMEFWYSGPYIESTHIVTALNDGGYSYDIFRAGNLDGVNYELPEGDAGRSILDNYEVVIWYSGWNSQILSDQEENLLADYLDGDCGEADNFCVENRNIIMLTQMIDWLDSNSGTFLNNYLHADTHYSSYIVVDGTSNPMDGVSESIFDGKEYTTDTAGTYYQDRPCGIKPDDGSSIAKGAFWMDVHKDAAHNHQYHAVQFPVDSYEGNQNHKAFTFAAEIGVFNIRSDRADFFGTILDWMEVEEETTQDNDLGISSLVIPRHHEYGDIEKYIPIEIKVGVTNYGDEAADYVNARLKIKTEEGLVIYDTTFDTRAFPEGHPMHIEEVLEPGETIIFTFNKTNHHQQLSYDHDASVVGTDTMIKLSGLHTLDVEVGGLDTNPSNNKIVTKIFSAVHVQTFEPDDSGYYYIDDTDDNGANSYEGVNWHLVNSYDWDVDGCGWASEVPENCDEDDGTLNHTGNFVAKNGDYALASFNQNAWYKDNAGGRSECDWGDISDADCPKFTPNPYQDDYVMFGPFDFSGMEEVVVNYFYSGCVESGDYARLQVSKDSVSWTNLISESGFCADEGAWYMREGENSRYVGHELSSGWYGSDDTQDVYLRIMMDADPDQNTEGSGGPYSGIFIDDFVIRGTENIARDVAVGDITVDNVFHVKDDGGNSLWREINATVINLGQAGWSDLPIQFSVTNLQGHDLSDYLDVTESTVFHLGGHSKYGDIRPGGGSEDQKELFARFAAPGANTYYLTVEILVPTGKDFFPENNSKTVEFRIFDTFFYDNVDTPSDRSDVYDYTKVDRNSGETNSWKERDIGDNAFSQRMVWQYAEEESYDRDNPTTVSGSDDGLITQDIWDRDGEGSKFAPDVNLDLRAAYKPILTFAIKWDFADGDRLEVRAATDFDSDEKITSGTWNVLKTYEGDCDCTWSSSDKTTWQLEELSLEGFEGHQMWIEFRVVTTNGGGRGVMIDDLLVIGNEHRNNIMIDGIDLGAQAPEYDNELSVTIRSTGLDSQDDYEVYVYARIFDKFGVIVWPTDLGHTFFEVPETLTKGETYTVSPDTAGSDWRYGSDLVEGTYHIFIYVYSPNDENYEDSIWTEVFNLTNNDYDNDGVANAIDECQETPEGEEVDDYGCSDTQKDDDNDGVMNDKDECQETPEGEEVDDYGCSDSQKDSDNDGASNAIDECPETPEGEEIDDYGCSDSQKDTDSDGITDDVDECPDTNHKHEIDENGCSAYQLDDDNDGVANAIDECPETPEGEEINDNGCSASQRDSDFDEVYDDVDKCPDTFSHDIVDPETGCTVKSHILISAGDDITIQKGSTVQFNGAGSDEYHEIILYEWDFNSDGLYEWSSDENGRTTNIYNSAGNYVATFRITCSEGYTATDTITIIVNEGEGEEKFEEELDNGGETGILPSLSIISVLASLGFLAIARRRD